VYTLLKIYCPEKSGKYSHGGASRNCYSIPGLPTYGIFPLKTQIFLGFFLAFGELGDF
jgi:hypothetical protein